MTRARRPDAVNCATFRCSPPWHAGCSLRSAKGVAAMRMSRGAAVAPLAAVALLGSQGCAAVGLTLFATGAGVAAGQGTAYTLDGIAYRTFTAPIDDLPRPTAPPRPPHILAPSPQHITQQKRGTT